MNKFAFPHEALCLNKQIVGLLCFSKRVLENFVAEEHESYALFHSAVGTA